MKDYQAAILVLGLVSVGAVSAAETRSGRRIGSQPSSFRSPCGTAQKVSVRGGECLEPIFEIIEGRMPAPNTDAGIVSACNRFNTTSRCVRSLAKDCLSGIHKTAVGAVASATRRFHTNECKSVKTRAPYIGPLKCAQAHGPEIKNIFDAQTGLMQGVRDLPITAEEKIVKMCCVLNDLDVELAKLFDKVCPDSTSTVIKLVHAITDDARNTLCLSPKCATALEQVKNHKYKPPQNFIEPIQEILYQISV